MISLAELEFYLANFLLYDKKIDVERIDPEMANGLLIKGKENVEKIGFGVSASIALFEKALSAKCDAIIVHHAFNFPPFLRFDKIFQERIAFLLKHKISLFGYHFLLDSHPEIGNNMQILKKIGARSTGEYLHSGNPWGFIGEFKNGEGLDRIIEKLKPFLSPKMTFYDFGAKRIKKVVACSGKGAPYPSEMQFLIDNNIDLFITGEVHEWNRELFREAKINFLAGGHYATEVFGVKALMEKIKKVFSQIVVEWIEFPNEI